MVVRSESKVCPSYIMQVIKNISARNFFRLCPEIKKKYFWGGKLWISSWQAVLPNSGIHYELKELE